MKKFIVYGLGISGQSAVKFLLEKGFEVQAGDDKKESLEKLEKHPNLKLINDISQIDWNDVQSLVLAAGIPFKINPHKIVLESQKHNCKIVCDVEILYSFNSNANFIGITGTNGKSTTTALTSHIFEQAKKTYAAGGNIGNAALDLPSLGADENYIIEMSSYQIDLINKTKFHIANLLNITPDHLDRYNGFEDYLASKKRIFNNQNEKDFAIINIDDENSKKVFDELRNDENFSAKLIPISTKKIVDDGVSLLGDYLYHSFDEDTYMIFLGKREFLKGEHNAQNIAFAYANAYYSGIDETTIIKAIQSFKGLKHRLQFIANVNGINFINDSKATNAQSTENALHTYDNIYWILGGKAKEGGISSLAPYFPKIKSAFLIGDASDEFAKILEGKVKYAKCGNLENAFKAANEATLQDSGSEKNIILSPACASFDQWKNFEERGDFFIKLVNDLPK